MLYKEIPFAGYTVALASGIICGNYLKTANYCYLLFILITALLLLLHLLIYRQRSAALVYGMATHLCIFLFGCSSAAYRLNRNTPIPPGKRHFIARADAWPADKPRSVLIDISLLSVDGKKVKSGNRMLLYTRSHKISADLRPGSIISFSSSPDEISDFNTDDDFDYKLFMNRRGYSYSTFCNDSVMIVDDKPTIPHLALRLRKVFLQHLGNKLSKPESLAIVSAMTLGYRDMLDDRIKEQFRRSGIVHIMAVSGLHVGIIALLVIASLRASGIRSAAAGLLISLSVIWTYALLTGLSPSVTRASLMFSFLAAGSFIYRPARPINSVMASAFIILTVNPLAIYEASFLLSYSAVIAIVLNYRDLVAVFSFRGRLLNYFWRMVAVSILAQAGTLPFVALFFGELPLFSVLSNLFAIPLATIILASGFLLIAGLALPFLGEIASPLIDYSVSLLSDLAGQVSGLRFALISTGNVSAGRAVLLFVIIILLLRFILDNKRPYLHSTLALCILYFILR